MVERTVRDREAAGSSPVIPTNVDTKNHLHLVRKVRKASGFLLVAIAARCLSIFFKGNSRRRKICPPTRTKCCTRSVSGYRLLQSLDVTDDLVKVRRNAIVFVLNLSFAVY